MIYVDIQNFIKNEGISLINDEDLIDILYLDYAENPEEEYFYGES